MDFNNAQLLPNSVYSPCDGLTHKQVYCMMVVTRTSDLLCSVRDLMLVNTFSFERFID